MFFLLLLLGAICPTLGAVVPSVVRRDISPPLLEKFNRFSQFAAASNCRANHNETSPGSAVYCDSGFCNLVREDETQIIEGFWGISPGDTTGYLALDKTKKEIILVFRGTVSDENGQTDLQFFHTDASAACAGCKAHVGFWEASNAAIASLQPKVEKAAKQNPDYKIVLVGHSLGGALATLGAVTLRNAGHVVDLYTFGAPSVGNLAFAEFITQQTSGTNYRITHLNDEVPKVLYKAHKNLILGILVPEYSQTSPEYWITSGNGVPVGGADITVVEGINNEAGNLGTMEVTMEPHGWYMGSMSVCAEI